MSVDTSCNSVIDSFVKSAALGAVATNFVPSHAKKFPLAMPEILTSFNSPIELDERFAVPPSVAGAHSEPFHFRTSFGLGAVLETFCKSLKFAFKEKVVVFNCKPVPAE